MISMLNEFSNELCLTQIVSKPTHKDGNILDLVLTNNTNLIHHCSIIPVLQSTSHHSIAQVTTAYKSSYSFRSENRPKRTSFSALNFFSDDVDWESIENELKSVDWKKEFSDSTPDEMLDFFYHTCYTICQKYVPLKTEADKLKLNKIARYRRSLTRKRRRIKKRLLRITSPSQIKKLNDTLLQIEKDLQKSYKGSEIYMENKAIDAIKTNAKYFFTYANKKSKVKSKIGPLLNNDQKLTTILKKWPNFYLINTRKSLVSQWTLII